MGIYQQSHFVPQVLLQSAFPEQMPDLKRKVARFLVLAILPGFCHWLLLLVSAGIAMWRGCIVSITQNFPSHPEQLKNAFHAHFCCALRGTHLRKRTHCKGENEPRLSLANSLPSLLTEL